MTTSFSKSLQLSPCENVRLRTLDPRNARTNLPTRRLREPQSPFIHERVFDIEVLLVVEDCDVLVTVLRAIDAILVRALGICIFFIWRDGNGVERDR